MNEDFKQLKQRATTFYNENKVPEHLEIILNKMVLENPNDVFGRLSEFFNELAIDPHISTVSGKTVLNSSGLSALQCDIHAIVQNKQTKLASAQLALDVEMRDVNLKSDPETNLTDEDIILKSCSHMNGVISNILQDLPLKNQIEIDKTLSDWVDQAEKNESPAKEDINDESRTPTPSSGKKKKAPSAKASKPGKAPEKPIPPREFPPFRLCGCSAVSVTSLAVLKAASNFLNKPTFEHLNTTLKQWENKDSNQKGILEIVMPVPAMSIISGGKATPGKLNFVKNVFAIAKPGWSMQESVEKLTKVYHNVGKGLSAKSSTGIVSGMTGAYQPLYEKLEQPLDVVLEAISSAGLVAGQDVFIGIDCAGHEVFDYDKGKYEIATGALKSADEVCEMFKDLHARYPALIMVIDPLRKEDREQWPKICESLTEKCFVIGSDVIYGSLHNLTSAGLEARPSSGVAMSTGGRVTCYDLIRAVSDVKSNGGVGVLVAPPGDAGEELFTDLAVGLEVNIVRFGAPNRGENTTRINRLLEIEEYANKNDSINMKCQQCFNFPVILPPPPPVAPVSDDEVNEDNAAENKSGKKK